MRKETHGFTLMELLVGLGLVAIVLGVLSNYFLNSSRISLESRDRADMQQELLNVQQLITGRLREAWYVYPPGVSLTLAGSTAVTTRNPITKNSTWMIGTHPMLAMILPPRPAAGACSAGNSDGCYRFYAYYPVRRGTWVSGLSAASSNNPGDDPQNKESWLLAEYRATFLTSPNTGAFPPVPPPAPPAGLHGQLLADYLAPTTDAQAPYNMFMYTLDDTKTTVTGVTINLATLRQQGKTRQRLPDATGTFTQAVTPTNLGKVLAGP